ncbi:hypothetical protein BKA69DRAFT_1037328 [Paraphysoderma sedebokerense]|nr:hypothetical protein BKA69DRAFT_1037328 [Paraphysoderma sedebokerense]
MTKLHRHPDNAIIIPSYTVSDPKVQPSNDTALLSLLRYLRSASEKVNSQPSTDIREFMRSSPFSVIASSSLEMRSAISTSSNAVPVENRSSKVCRNSPSNHVDPPNPIQPNSTVDREKCGYGRSKTTYVGSNNDNDIRYVIANGWRTFDDHDYEKSLELSTGRVERPVHRPKQKLRTKKQLVDSIVEITEKISSVKVSLDVSET